MAFSPLIGRFLDIVPGLEINNAELCRSWLKLPDVEHTSYCQGGRDILRPLYILLLV